MEANTTDATTNPPYIPMLAPDDLPAMLEAFDAPYWDGVRQQVLAFLTLPYGGTLETLQSEPDAIRTLYEAYGLAQEYLNHLIDWCALILEMSSRVESIHLELKRKFPDMGFDLHSTPRLTPWGAGTA